MMKKLLFALLGIAVFVIAALAIGPRLIDLRPRVAAAVHDATGRDLRIDGDLSLALLPKLRIFASDVHLSNAPGATAPEMASIESVAFEGELWPLLRKRVVINSLIVKRPTINLEVDKAGRPNWVFATQDKPEQEPGQQPEAESGSSLTDVRIGEVGIEQGQISYRDAATGQAIHAKDVTLGGAMADPERPLALKGHMRLNDEPVTADLTVDNVGKLQRSEQADIKLALDTKHVTAKFDGTAQRRPVPGLNGVFDLAIPSVGRLAAWLNEPLDSTQPDPGPLTVHAVFESTGTKSLLKEATVTGTGLDAKASGSFDAGGSPRKITAVAESGVLDLDRYLPPRARDKGPSQDIAGTPRQGQALAKEAPAGVSDRPFDLGALRELEANIKVSIAGVKAMGYEIGRIAFTTEAKAGVVVADLAELALYGGTVKGTAKLDGAGDHLGVQTAVTVDRVTVDKLARQAAAGAPPVSGVISATLDAEARGNTPRALMDDLRGHLAVDLGGLNASAFSAISQLKLDVVLPGTDKAPSLKANATYKGERVDASATLAPLGKLASGERFPAKLAVDSELVTLRYDGTLQQKPVAGIDGTFDVDVPSVGKLAAWVGQPLDPKQPDPGPIKLKALLATDGTTLTLKDAAVSGKAIDATARASFDAGRQPPLFDAKLDVRQANIDAYLPPTEKRSPASPAPRQQRPQQATGWSTERFDLAALASADGKLEATLAAVRYQGLEIVNGKLALELAGGVLKLVTEKIAVAQGTIDSVTTLDASGGGAKLAHRVTVARVQARPLLKAFADSDRVGGTIDFQTEVTGSGANQQQLISSLNGTGRFKVSNGAIYGIDLVAALRKAGSIGFGSSQGEETDFGELSGSYTIRSGVIENNDLQMSAPLLGLTGNGRVPMPTQTIDYMVEARLGGRESLAGVPIPIKVTGTWSNPRYEPDWGNALQTIANQPERLKNLPGELGKTAKDLGIGLPGMGQTPAPSGQSTPPKPTGLPFSLPKGLLGE